MKIIECSQGTDEWKAARLGRVTASRIPDIMAKLKNGGEPASRRDYKMQLVSEILTGVPQEEIFVTKEMAWGTEQEQFARVAYELVTGRSVDQLGFVVHPSIDRAGASPDGLVHGPQLGLVEIKCPKSTTHICTLLDGDIPEKYIPQMLFQMACTGAHWCDFISFDPRLPENAQLFVSRLHRNESAIAGIESAVLDFLMEVDEMIATVKSYSA